MSDNKRSFSDDLLLKEPIYFENIILKDEETLLEMFKLYNDYWQNIYSILWDYQNEQIDLLKDKSKNIQLIKQLKKAIVDFSFQIKQINRINKSITKDNSRCKKALATYVYPNIAAKLICDDRLSIHMNLQLSEEVINSMTDINKLPSSPSSLINNDIKKIRSITNNRH